MSDDDRRLSVDLSNDCQMVCLLLFPVFLSRQLWKIAQGLSEEAHS